MASLTNSGSSAVERSLETDIFYQTEDLEICYELPRCFDWVKAGNYQKVCLQFPDDLLGDAPAVARKLKLLLDQTVYILGDTTYGSCCVDEVAAEHVGADAVIHFGRTCLSPSRRLPVLYVFTRIPVDVAKVVSGLSRAIDDSSSRLIFIYDTRCQYIAEAVSDKLREHFPQILSSAPIGYTVKENFSNDSSCNNKKLCHTQTDGEGTENERDEGNDLNAKKQTDGEGTENERDKGNDLNAKKEKIIIFNGRQVILPTGAVIKDYQFVYLGPDGPTLTSILFRFSENTFHCINPSDGSVKASSGIRSLMSRSRKLEMAKDAEIIGVLVGTLGITDYCAVISRLKGIIKKAGKKSYTFVVGKPNEPKLCNIPEVDVFVYVSCPETAFLERHTDPMLYKKLITPWELEVALLDGQDWSLEFESDFRQLLPSGRRHVEITDAPLDERINVSLLTNKTQRLGISHSPQEVLDSSTGAVVLQNGLIISELHVGGAGELLKNRAWHGLDASLPAPAPLNHVAEGRSGIASVYENERDVSNT